MGSINAFSEVVTRTRESWRELLVTDIVFKAIAFVTLAPLLGLCQRLTISLASDGLLSDADFVLLFAHPVGIASSILVASVWLGILGLELASLLAILASKDEGHRLRPLAAIQFAFSRAFKVLAITAALTVASLLILAPIGLIAFAVYRSLLGEFDINF